MSSLIPTPFTGRVVWLGVVADSETDIRAKPVPSFELSFAGPPGECHAGLTRPSCSRVLELYPRDTKIRNVRQLSIVSEEELQWVAKKMGVDAIDPASVGATMVVRGIPDLTHVPPASRLQETTNGATLCVDMENRPCIFSGRVIATDTQGKDGRANQFKECLQGLRGITAWVEREGEISVGDELSLYIPDQRAWKHMHLSDAHRAAQTCCRPTAGKLGGALLFLLLAICVAIWMRSY
jgi:hypothetical protein